MEAPNEQPQDQPQEQPQDGMSQPAPDAASQLPPAETPAEPETPTSGEVEPNEAPADDRDTAELHPPPTPATPAEPQPGPPPIVVPELTPEFLDALRVVAKDKANALGTPPSLGGAYGNLATSALRLAAAIRGH